MKANRKLARSLEFLTKLPHCKGAEVKDGAISIKTDSQANARLMDSFVSNDIFGHSVNFETSDGAQIPSASQNHFRERGLSTHTRRAVQGVFEPVESSIKALPGVKSASVTKVYSGIEEPAIGYQDSYSRQVLGPQHNYQEIWTNGIEITANARDYEVLNEVLEDSVDGFALRVRVPADSAKKSLARLLKKGGIPTNTFSGGYRSFSLEVKGDSVDGSFQPAQMEPSVDFLTEQGVEVLPPWRKDYPDHYRGMYKGVRFHLSPAPR